MFMVFLQNKGMIIRIVIRKKELYMYFMRMTPFVISLMGCIYLSIFSKKLNSKTVTIIEYILWIIVIIGILILIISTSEN